MASELIVLVTGGAPFAEVDAAIPLGLAFGLTPLAAYLLAVTGNLLVIAPLLWFWRSGVQFLGARSTRLQRLFNWVFHYTRTRHGARMQTTGLGALTLLLALPIPFLGGWTATVLAFLFDLPFWKSFFAIGLGVVIGALVVLGISLGVVHIV